MSNRFKRLVDLFTEGTECFLGDDEQGKPVLMYVAKLNSFAEDEARQDGLTGRTVHTMELDDPESPIMKSVLFQVNSWTDEELLDRRVDQKYEEMYALAMADVDADPEWADKLEYLRRGPELLNDAKVKEDDPRRKQLADYNVLWAETVEKAAEKRVEDLKVQCKGMKREELEEEFLKDYKDKSSIEAFMTERRVTQLYFALRICDAVRGSEPGTWNHSACNHRERLLDDREQVRELPEHVVSKAVDTLEALAIGARNVANFPAAPNGSEASAPPNDVEESTASSEVA